MPTAVGNCGGAAEVSIRAGADVNAKHRAGESALSIATRSSASQVGRLLRRAGARK